MLNRFEGKQILLKSLLVIEVVEECLSELLGLVGFHFAEDILGDFPVVLVETANQPAPELVQPNLQVQIAYQRLYSCVLLLNL